MMIRILLVLLFVISISANFLLYEFASTQRHHFNKIRLAPLGLESFGPLSSEIDYVIMGDSHASYWKNFPFQHRNYGIGGQTSQQILLRSHHHAPPHLIDHLVLICGANDIQCLSTIPNQKSSVVKRIVRNIESIIEQYPDAKVHVFTIPPIFSSTLKNHLKGASKFNSIREEVNQLLSQHVILHKNAVLHSTDKIFKNQDLKKLTIDGVHMNTKAYELINSYLIKVNQESKS